jgi:hypothetical protein
MAAIFISYRKTRDGKESTSDAAHAEYLAGDLRDAFGHDSVFLDDQEPFIGRFDDFLNNELGRCQAVVVVIGQAWLERSKDFLNAEDWVRHEIEFGLKQKRTMVPVFFDNVTINDAKKALKPAADWGLVPPALPQKNALRSAAAWEFLSPGLPQQNTLKSAADWGSIAPALPQWADKFFLWQGIDIRRGQREEDVERLIDLLEKRLGLERLLRRGGVPNLSGDWVDTEGVDVKLVHHGGDVKIFLLSGGRMMGEGDATIVGSRVQLSIWRRDLGSGAGSGTVSANGRQVSGLIRYGSRSYGFSISKR